jgi:6-hydroxymethylpterin diphosphokinase MptE-like protein
MARPQGALFSINLLGKKEKEAGKLDEAWQFLRWRYKYAPRLRKFHNLHQGEDCFILGNGPSLNKMDLAPLANYHTFGQNKIFMIFDRVDLNLSYLVSVNPYVIGQSKKEFESMTCPVFVSHTAARGIIEDKPHVQRLHTLNLWSFYKDITQPICEGNTVTFVSLQIAYYMGFKRVFLIGVDHSFKQKGASHEVQVYKGEDENHFHPDYFKGQQWQLADVYGSEVSYHLANYYYQKDGRQIFDATVGGKLEVFPKMDITEALKIARKKG